MENTNNDEGDGPPDDACKPIVPALDLQESPSELSGIELSRKESKTALHASTPHDYALDDSYDPRMSRNSESRRHNHGDSPQQHFISPVGLQLRTLDAKNMAFFPSKSLTRLSIEEIYGPVRKRTPLASHKSTSNLASMPRVSLANRPLRRHIPSGRFSRRTSDSSTRGVKSKMNTPSLSVPPSGRAARPYDSVRKATPSGPRPFLSAGCSKGFSKLEDLPKPAIGRIPSYLLKKKEASSTPDPVPPPSDKKSTEAATKSRKGGSQDDSNKQSSPMETDTVKIQKTRIVKISPCQDKDVIVLVEPRPGPSSSMDIPIETLPSATTAPAAGFLPLEELEDIADDVASPDYYDLLDLVDSESPKETTVIPQEEVDPYELIERVSCSDNDDDEAFDIYANPQPSTSYAPDEPVRPRPSTSKVHSEPAEKKEDSEDSESTEIYQAYRAHGLTYENFSSTSHVTDVTIPYDFLDQFVYIFGGNLERTAAFVRYGKILRCTCGREGNIEKDHPCGKHMDLNRLQYFYEANRVIRLYADPKYEVAVYEEIEKWFANEYPYYYQTFFARRPHIFEDDFLRRNIRAKVSVVEACRKIIEEEDLVLAEFPELDDIIGSRRNFVLQDTPTSLYEDFQLACMFFRDEYPSLFVQLLEKHEFLILAYERMIVGRNRLMLIDQAGWDNDKLQKLEEKCRLKAITKSRKDK